MVNRLLLQLRRLYLRYRPNYAIKLRGECILCGLEGQRHIDLCLACETELPVISHCCRRCALPLLNSYSPYCGQCLHAPPPFTRTVAVWLYHPPIAQLIGGFKYHKHYSYGRTLALAASGKFANAYSDTCLPDIIAPTPLHWWRQFKRGFNQSAHLAEQLSSSLGIPLERPLQRHKTTAAQQSLNAKQRKQNLKGAFTVMGDVQGKTIAIVDDVMTTGATADEISRCLLAAGATEVHIWCLARTPA
ncbi:MAG: phosphoribosyltransferase family protein [Spongiibacteraceae bacterium]